MKLLIEDNIVINDIKFYLNLFRLYRSFLLLISDQKDMGIGTVTLGSPPVIEGMKSPNVSYNLFGIDTKLLSTIIVEKAANTLKAPVLLLLFIKNKIKNEDIVRPISNFLNKILEKVVKESD